MNDVAQSQFVPLAGPDLGGAEHEAVGAVVRSGLLAQGRKVEAFEEALRQVASASFACAVSSGTTALELALRALGVGRGDEVIVPAFTFVATASAVLSTGASVRLADVDPHTYCVTANSVAEVLSRRTRVVLPVHLFGFPAPVDEIRHVLPQAVTLVEDAAQALGTALPTGPVGARGTATFSFYPTKVITTGEGGAVTTDVPQISQAVKSIRNHGMSGLGTYDFVRAGTNARMTDMGAAMGIVQLSRLPAFLARRASIAARYLAELEGVDLPLVPNQGRPNWSVFTVATDERQLLAERLDRCGVGWKVFYPFSLDELSFLECTDRAPTARQVSRRVISLPIRSDMSDEEVDRVIAAVNDR